MPPCLAPCARPLPPKRRPAGGQGSCAMSPVAASMSSAQGAALARDDSAFVGAPAPLKQPSSTLDVQSMFSSEGAARQQGVLRWVAQPPLPPPLPPPLGRRAPQAGSSCMRYAMAQYTPRAACICPNPAWVLAAAAPHSGAAAAAACILAHPGRQFPRPPAGSPCLASL